MLTNQEKTDIVHDFLAIAQKLAIVNDELKKKKLNRRRLLNLFGLLKDEFDNLYHLIEDK